MADKFYQVQLWRKGWQWEIVSAPMPYAEARKAVFGLVPLGAAYRVWEAPANAPKRLIGKAGAYDIWAGSDENGKPYFSTQESGGGYGELESLLKLKGLALSDYRALHA